ncbi:MAG: hypothetical protein PHP96_03415 [Candidatus Dojkabacteria bacterium]|nr:hypothetical protein [Candidatus Dojkabacteria bacterium]
MVAGDTSYAVGSAVSTAVDPPVQMLQSTLNQFNQLCFAYEMTALIEALIIAFLFFVFKPYIPFIISKLWSHLPVVGIMTRVRNVIPFGGFTLRNGMYRKEFRNNVMYYDKKYLGSYFFMGVPFDFVHIDRGFVQDADKNKFVETLSKMGYKSFNSIENALTFNSIDPSDPNADMVIKNMGFDSYESAKRIINPSGLVVTSEIYAPKYSSIPLDALLQYCSDWSPGSIAAQVSDTYEFRKPPAEKNLIMDLLPYILLFVSMAIAFAILATQIK